MKRDVFVKTVNLWNRKTRTISLFQSEKTSSFERQVISMNWNLNFNNLQDWVLKNTVSVRPFFSNALCQTHLDNSENLKDKKRDFDKKKKQTETMFLDTPSSSFKLKFRICFYSGWSRDVICVCVFVREVRIQMSVASVIKRIPQASVWSWHIETCFVKCKIERIFVISFLCNNKYPQAKEREV
jgi:hypothetical protein